jgi:threonine/homoserine/homoserine lactone efflux protein
MLGAFLTFAAASTLLAMVPGPDTLVMLRSILLEGRRTAVLTALGILTGLSVWICAAALGLTALLRASHDGFLALRIVGAVYLTVLGVRALYQRATGATSTDSLTTPRRALVGRGFRAGLLTDLLNPKVGVFFITFLPAFIPHGEPVAVVTLGLGAVFLGVSAVYYAVLLAFVDRLTRWLRSPRFQRRLSKVTGVVLIGFGVRLAVEG